MEVLWPGFRRAEGKEKGKGVVARRGLKEGHSARMSSKTRTTSPAASGDYDMLVSSIVLIHQQTQDFAAKAVNVVLTLRNWLIGYRIVEFEQRGNDRAAYGERIPPALSQRLSAAGLKRVDVRELRRFRLLYVAYPQFRETVTPELLTRFGAGAIQPHARCAAAYREFVERVGETSEARGSKTQLVLEAISKMTSTFSLTDLERACPGVSRDMIRRVLVTQKGQTLDCIGRGPGALWQKRGN